MLKIRQKATPRKRRKASLRLALRNSAGIYMVELLVAIMIGTMILFTLTSMLGTTLRLGATTQNEVYAQEILQDLIEFTRGAGYKYFETKKGSYTLLTNKLSTSESGPVVRTAPVQLDFVGREWNLGTKNARFQGIVTYTIEDGPDPNTLKVTINVAWSDSTSYNSTPGEARQITKSTTITKNGIDKYAIWK